MLPESNVQFPVQANSEAPLGYCLKCITSWMDIRDENEKLLDKSMARPMPVINPAITLVAGWQGRAMGPGQTIYGVIAAPTCEGHIRLQSKADAARASATAAGLQLPGAAGFAGVN